MESGRPAGDAASGRVEEGGQSTGGAVSRVVEERVRSAGGATRLLRRRGEQPRRLAEDDVGERQDGPAVVVPPGATYRGAVERSLLRWGRATVTERLPMANREESLRI